MRVSGPLFKVKLPPFSLSLRDKKLSAEKFRSGKDEKPINRNDPKSIIQSSAAKAQDLFFLISGTDAKDQDAKRRFKKMYDKSFATKIDKGLINTLSKKSLPMDEKTRVVAESFVQKFCPESDYKPLFRLMSVDYPLQWFSVPAFPRKIIFHVGPTNSGKTYNAIEALKSAKKGLYCAPLRLLAAEMYDRLNGSGFPCLLRTGEALRDENRNILNMDQFSEKTNEVGLVSCTVEMFSTSEEYDVAVIDEIQLLSDESRGFAFTNALISLKAKELHLCGELGAIDLIKRLLRPMQETVTVKEYKRLGELIVTKNQNESYQMPEKGDCIVAFSRNRLYVLKKQLESQFRIKCALIYGAMPYEVRLEQADLFNRRQETGYDVLLATDAIGLGLNLSIKRIVFHSMQKMTGDGITPVPVPLVKQIGGRAGRYVPGSVPNPGYVLTYNGGSDHRYMEACMSSPPTIYEKAGILPTEEQIMDLSCLYPKATFFEIISFFSDYYKLSSDYFLCNLTAWLGIAKILEDYPRLSFSERIKMCQAPVKVDDPIMVLVFRKYMSAFHKGIKCGTNVIVPKTVETERPLNLSYFETLHATLNLYLWLNIRYPEMFHEQEKALNDSRRCVIIIEKELVNLTENVYLKPGNCQSAFQRIRKALGDDKGPILPSENGSQKLRSVFLSEESTKVKATGKQKKMFLEDQFSEEYEIEELIFENESSKNSEMLDLFYQSIQETGKEQNHDSMEKKKPLARAKQNDLVDEKLTDLYCEGLKADARHRCIKREEYNQYFSEDDSDDHK